MPHDDTRLSPSDQIDVPTIVFKVIVLLRLN